jgi:hypothetical protein
MIKARAFLVPAAILFCATLIGLRTRGADDRVFEGEVADSQCATNVHSLTRSHNEMIAMGSAGKTPADCAHFCVHSRGGKYVLLVKHEVYKLDNQDLAEQNAGFKVKVSGALDPKTNIITVRSIDQIPAK